MSETRKLAAILVSDVVGYSRLAGADEDRTLARLRGLRSDLIDPLSSDAKCRLASGAYNGVIPRHAEPNARGRDDPDQSALAASGL